MRELEVCHMSVISLSSPVVSLLFFEMIGFSFEPVGTCNVHKEKRATRILGPAGGNLALNSHSSSMTNQVI